MKLHSPQFEGELKRAIRETIRGSPALKQEYRRAKKYRKHLKLLWLSRLAFSIALAGAVWQIERRTGHLSAAAAVIGFYLLVMLYFRIQNLRTQLFRSVDLLALTFLPVTIDQIFRRQIQKYFQGSLYLLADLLLALGTLAAAAGLSAWEWPAVIFYALVAWLNLLGLAGYCIFRVPLLPFQLLTTFSFFLSVAFIYAFKFAGPPVISFVDHYASELNLLLPTAWPLASLNLLDSGREWWSLALCLPVAVIIGSLKGSIISLRGRMVYQELIVREAHDLLPRSAKQSAAGPDASRHLGPTEIEEILASGSFLEQPGFPLKYFPERRLWAWLTPREKALAEFVYPTGVVIGANWKTMATVVLAACVLVPLGGLVNLTTEFSLLGIEGFFVLCLIAVAVFNHGRAFAPRWGSGVSVPTYAYFGVGYRELNCFFFKHTVIQLPFLAATFIFLGGFTAFCIQLPVVPGLVIGFKAAGLIFAARFAIVSFAFSGGTNDSSRFRLSSFLLILAAAIMGFAIFGLGLISLVLPPSALSFVFWVGAMLLAWLFHWSYGWFYRHARFDLTRVVGQ